MSGGSQHNPNGRQSQLGSGWSPLQLQVASYLARAPQAHMASERGVTWHTPTPPHLYHVPAPSPPDPLQVMKSGAAAAAGNSVFRHTATPPDLYRHTPTPPDKHLLRHTPSPGDVKGGPIPPPDIFPHLGQPRDKLVRPEDMLSYARGGVDLTLSRSAAAANGAPIALSVRDAPTINSLIARAQPHPPPAHPRPHPRVDSLLERLAPSPVSPHSVIVHPRGPATPSPPDSNEDSADSCGAPPGSKRKRKPERVVRVPSVPPPPTPPDPVALPLRAPSTERAAVAEPRQEACPRLAPPPPPLPPPPPQPARLDAPLENGETPHATTNGPEQAEPTPHARRKTRSGSAETIADIAAMIAGTEKPDGEPGTAPEKSAELMEVDAPVTVDKLKSVLASPEPDRKQAKAEEQKRSPPSTEEVAAREPSAVETAGAAAPRRRSARSSKSECTNAPVESPSEGKPAEAEASEAGSAGPVPASIVDVEDQLEKMFAGIEEQPDGDEHPGKQSTTAIHATPRGKKRRKSSATKGEKKVSRRSSRAGEEGARARKGGRKRGGGAGGARGGRAHDVKEYDSGSNASSGRSRGPYIQIRGPRDSPLSVSVINATTGEEEEAAGGAGGAGGGRRKGGEDFRNGLRTRGLHCSTLGLRYDATTPDASWVCAFCGRGPHATSEAGAPHRPLGDLFGPYTVTTDCDEFRALDEATRRRRAPPATTPLAPATIPPAAAGGGVEVWMHEECAVWAPGLLAWGARVWGLAGAVWGAAGARCGACGRTGAGLACSAHACPARSHVPCARGWLLSEAQYRALCPRHRPAD